MVAAVAPNLTAVAPVKPVPVITTEVPPAIGPLPGADLQAHHYLFELYTLDKMLDVPRDVTLDQLKAAIKGHQTGQRGVLAVRCCTDSK